MEAGEDTRVLSAAAAQASDVLTEPQGLGSMDGLALYRTLYLRRAAQSIHFDYRGLVQFLGWEPFVELVRAYLQAHPPAHYNIARLSDHLPEFIEQFPDLPEQGYCLDLARLERTVCAVNHAASTPVLRHDQIARVDGDRLGRIQLQPVTALRLLELTFPVNDFLSAVVEDRPRPRDRGARRNQLVVFRFRYDDTRRLPLPLPRYRLLESLVSGTPLGAALDQAVNNGLDADSAVASVFGWVSEGFFSGFTVG